LLQVKIYFREVQGYLQVDRKDRIKTTSDLEYLEVEECKGEDGEDTSEHQPDNV
jgi:hypothetical protein